MNLIQAALRRPFTVMVAVVAIAMGSGLAARPEFLHHADVPRTSDGPASFWSLGQGSVRSLNWPGSVFEVSDAVRLRGVDPRLRCRGQ